MLRVLYGARERGDIASLAARLAHVAQRTLLGVVGIHRRIFGGHRQTVFLGLHRGMGCEQNASVQPEGGQLAVQARGIEEAPLRCEQLPGIRRAGPDTVGEWILHQQAIVVRVNPAHKHTPLRSRNCRIILEIPYGPDDTAYVLAGRVDGTAVTADIMAAFTWIAMDEISGYDLARHSPSPPTLWTWIMPYSARKPARFPILIPAQEHVDQYGGLLLSHEVPNPTHPGVRDYHVVHPTLLAAWFATHPFCYGTLRRHGPCAYYADIDGEFNIAPKLRDREFAEAEVWKIIDEVVQVLKEWGVEVTSGDFRCDETRRENKFSVHILSDGFHFETEWLARVFGAYIHERLYARDDVYHFTFTDRAGGEEVRIVDDLAVRGRGNNFRFGGKRTSGAEGLLFAAPWPRSGKVAPAAPDVYFLGIPQYIQSTRRIGYRDFNETGRAYLRDLHRSVDTRAPRAYNVASHSLGALPDWFTKNAWPYYESTGFIFQARAAFDGDEVLLRVIGHRRTGEDVRCPRCAVDHPEDYSSIYVIVHDGSSWWGCFRSLCSRKRARAQ